MLHAAAQAMTKQTESKRDEVNVRTEAAQVADAARSWQV